jgi:hypothetical protein
MSAPTPSTTDWLAVSAYAPKDAQPRQADREAFDASGFAHTLPMPTAPLADDWHPAPFTTQLRYWLGLPLGNALMLAGAWLLWHLTNHGA